MNNESEALTDTDMKEIEELSRALSDRVYEENPCGVTDLYAVTDEHATHEQLLLLRMYDKFLRPGVDQYTIDTTFKYLREQGIDDPSTLTTNAQMDAIQLLIDALDGYEETLPERAKYPYIWFLLEDIGRAESMASLLNDRGYLPLTTLRSVLADAGKHPKSLGNGVL